MKKLVLTLVAAVAMNIGAMAQETQGEKRERPQMDPKEMIQQRTDETVEKYGLNEEIYIGCFPFYISYKVLS